MVNHPERRKMLILTRKNASKTPQSVFIATEGMFEQDSFYSISDAHTNQ